MVIAALKRFEPRMRGVPSTTGALYQFESRSKRELCWGTTILGWGIDTMFQAAGAGLGAGVGVCLTIQ